MAIECCFAVSFFNLLLVSNYVSLLFMTLYIVSSKRNNWNCCDIIVKHSPSLSTGDVIDQESLKTLINIEVETRTASYSEVYKPYI